jgi:hypothetical protein
VFINEVVIFVSTKDLIDFAEKFLHERIESLEKDVMGCIKNAAPFPGLLYCFSIVDLLGALYEGNVSGDVRKYGYHAGTTRIAREYMMKMMNYAAYETKLLQRIFGHKTVHLGQPKAMILDRTNKKKIGWALENTYSGKHMLLQKLPYPQKAKILMPYDMTVDHVLIVSIQRFMQDIKDSVNKTPLGYMELVKQTNIYQEKFETAVEQIYDPNN